VVIIYVQEGERGIRVTYGKQFRGRRQRGGQTIWLPLRVNTAGMIPLIFAQSLLMLPGVAASYLVGAQTPWIKNSAQVVSNLFDGSSPFYWIAYFVLVILFTYFYTEMIFEQQDMATNIQEHGGYIRGHKPGRPSSKYLREVVRRITLAGAVFLGVVAILPWLVNLLLTVLGVMSSTSQYSSSMIISSSGLLIAVGVVLDTMHQLDAELTTRNYKGLL
jgi:preprotein translocase subunit SecY